MRGFLCLHLCLSVRASYKNTEGVGTGPWGLGKLQLQHQQCHINCIGMWSASQLSTGSSTSTSCLGQVLIVATSAWANLLSP